MSNVSREVYQWLQRVLQPEYLYIDRTIKDVVETIAEIHSLRPKTEIFTYENGTSRLLLLLHGSIAIRFRDADYGIPINVWLPQDYPIHAPLIFVVPTDGMGVRPGNHVDIDRKCYHPYLAQWSTDPAQSRLRDALRILQQVFSREPPIYALPSRVRQSSPDGSNAMAQNRPPVPAKVQYNPGAHSNSDERRQSKVRQSIHTHRQNSPSPLPGLQSHLNYTNHYPRERSIASDSPFKPIGLFQKESKTIPQIDLLSSEKDESHIVNVPERPSNPRASELIRQISEFLLSIRESECDGILLQIRQEENIITDLNSRSTFLANEIHALDRVVRESEHNAAILRNRIAYASQLTDQTRRSGLPDIDKCLVAQNAVYNQVYEVVAQELAIEDTIYALGKALENECIQLDDFFKHVKILAREQFTLRAMVNKISEQLTIE